MAAVAESLLTAEEFQLLPDNDRPCELVRGRIVEMNVPMPRHGYFCARIARILGNFVEEHDLARVMTNDSGVVTERGPDTVRGADICYYSYTRMPKGPIPEGYHSVAPELVVEVRSPSDRWPRILTKVGEYLDAGVLVVGVHDEQTETLTLYRPEDVQKVLTLTDELTFPELFGDKFRISVRRFFE